MHRALIVVLALSGCVVHEEVRLAAAPCAVEPLVAPPPVFVSEDPVEQPMPSRARSISLGYIGDEPLTPSVPSGSGSGHAWQDYMRRGSWSTGLGSYRSYPQFRPWRADPAAYGYTGR